MTPEQWQKVIDTNLTGVFNTVHPVWPGMRERKFGRVIVISAPSTDKKASSGQVNYAATKAGDLGIVQISGAGRSPRRHHRERGLPRLHRNGNGHALVPEDVREHKNYSRRSPPAVLGEPEEIARCVVFLASDEVRLH